ncbi:MAG: GerMN domain-containing protein [Syntrophomonas sp.]|nr:GerMN domain-containing protein [Syntrophomonas sp.]
MTKRLIVCLGLALLVICLLSGGCSKVDESKINAWKDMIKIPVSTEKNNLSDKEILVNDNQSPDLSEKIEINLYFEDPQQHKLVLEKRSIVKVEGIARQTMHELINGPTQTDLRSTFPAGTQLLDINIKPDGLCIIDLSSEATTVTSKEQGKLMLLAIADTLSQFPTINKVSFLINGENIYNSGAMVDFSKPVQADYSMTR